MLHTHSVPSISLAPAMKMSWRLWIGPTARRKGFQNTSATASAPRCS